MPAEGPLYFELHALEIRLLKIAPGGWDDEIDCQLIHASLPNKPVFDALSYAWGSPKRVRSILLNRERRKVTVSAHQALRRLRQIYGTATVWIDALCINQSDDEERTKQVGLMRDIFTSARQVIVYLGEVQNSKPKDPSKSKALSKSKTLSKAKALSKSKAMSKPKALSKPIFFQPEAGDDILSSFATRCSLQYASKIPKINKASDVFCLIHSIAGAQNLEDAAPFDAGWRRAADSEYHRRLFEALRHLMRCRWWNRMWTLQEVVVPRDITIIYGPCVSTWDMFTRAARAYSDHKASEAIPLLPFEYTKVIDFYSQTILGIEAMRNRWTSGEQTTLLPLLRQFSGRKATDARDRVYALLGLVRGHLPVQPDYSLDVETVYRRTALGIISSTRTLSVLNGDTGRKLRQDLPSWVPDWTAEYHDLDRYRAETVQHYAATLKSSVYVKSRTFQELRGVEGLLEYMCTETQKKPIPQKWKIEDYTNVLGESDWKEYLPSRPRSSEITHEVCLRAVEDFLTVKCGPVCVQDCDKSTIRTPGLHLSEIVTVGAASMDQTDLIPTIQSWAILAVEKTEHAIRWPDFAFMRTICADIIYPKDRSVSGCRRICPEDLKAIAHWLIHQPSSPFGTREVAKNPRLFPIRCEIEKNFPEDESSKELYATLDVEHSVLLATSRRAFFMTNEKKFGLGPAKTSPKDQVYVLLGARTPFILQLAGCCKILEGFGPSSGYFERPCFQIVGDCFFHGAMDGEAMKCWRELSTAGLKTLTKAIEDIESKKQAEVHLRQYVSAEEALHQFLNALHGWYDPILKFTKLSKKLRRNIAIGREDWMIQENDLADINDWKDEGETREIWLLSEEDDILDSSERPAMKGRLGRRLMMEGEEMVLRELRQTFATKLERTKPLVREAKIDVHVREMALEAIRPDLASNWPYVFLM